MFDGPWPWAICGAGLGVGVGWGARQLSAGRPGQPILLVIAIQAGLVFWGAVRGEGLGFRADSMLLSAILLTLALVDISILRLPDVLTLPLIAAGLALAGVGGKEVSVRLVGAAVGYAALSLLALGFRRLRGRDGIGMGDAKLLAAAGAWLGWRALPWTVLLACALAFAWVGGRRVREGRESLARPLPFGAPLAAAFWIVWLYGAPGS